MAEDIRIEPISPPLLLNAHGESRRVGFELELSGLELEQIARIIVKLYGGEIYRENQHKYRVSNTRFGTFRVELDFALLEGTDLQKYFEEIGIQEKGLKRSIENIITKLAKTVLPYKVISPPVSMDEIKAMDILREELNREKALGTKASIAYAFGLHINPETPSFQVEVILSYLRAFLLLYNWLKERVKVFKLLSYSFPFLRVLRRINT